MTIILMTYNISDAIALGTRFIIVSGLICEYQSTYGIPETYAAIIVAGSVGILFNGLLSAAEMRLLAWIPEARHDS